MSNRFVKIGDTRIKASNIKSFGVAYEKQQGASHPISWIVAGIREKRDFGSFFDGVKGSISPSDRKYLYVTTYQNDNYEFYSSEINISETMKELESL